MRLNEELPCEKPVRLTALGCHHSTTVDTVRPSLELVSLFMVTALDYTELWLFRYCVLLWWQCTNRGCALLLSLHTDYYPSVYIKIRPTYVILCMTIDMVGWGGTLGRIAWLWGHCIFHFYSYSSTVWLYSSDILLSAQWNWYVYFQVVDTMIEGVASSRWDTTWHGVPPTSIGSRKGAPHSTVCVRRTSHSGRLEGCYPTVLYVYGGPHIQVGWRGVTPQYCMCTEDLTFR